MVFDDVRFFYSNKVEYILAYFYCRNENNTKIVKVDYFKNNYLILVIKSLNLNMT